MIVFGGVATIGIAFSAYVSWRLIHDGDAPTFPDWIFGASLTLIASAISAAVGLGITALIGAELPEQFVNEPSSVRTLAALRSSDSIAGAVHGSLFLAVGSVGGDRTYYFYEQQGDRLAPDHLNGDTGIYIYEENRAGAILETHDWRFAKPWYSLFGVRYFGHTYYFRVPIGSVSREVSLR